MKQKIPVISTLFDRSVTLLSGNAYKARLTDAVGLDRWSEASVTCRILLYDKSMIYRRFTPPLEVGARTGGTDSF